MNWSSVSASPVVRAVLLGAPLFAMGLVLTVWYAQPIASPPLEASVLYFVALLVLFTAAEFGQIHFEYRHRALSMSVSDLPLAIGLFLVAPPWILAARLLGAVISFVVRKRAFSRISFNAGLFALEVGMSCLLASLLFLPGGAANPINWMSLLLVLLVNNAFGLALVLAAARFVDGLTVKLRFVVNPAIAAGVSTIIYTAFGAMAALLLQSTPWGLLALVVPFIAVMSAHRMYYQLLKSRALLRSMTSLTRGDSVPNSSDEVIEALLANSCALLHAERATLRPPTWLLRSEIMDPDGPGVILSHQTRNVEQRAWLAAHGLRDAVIAPVRQNDDLTAVLVVGNRLGEIGTFDSEDLEVLQTLIAHVEVLWHNSSLVDKLRHDALHDPLTGMGNRRGLLEDMSDHLATTTVHPIPEPRLGLTPVAPPDEQCAGLLAVLEICQYPSVHDALGQQVADMLLVHAATRLDECLASDVSIARVGDDKFAVLVRHCRTETQALQQIERMRVAVSKPLESQGMRLDAGARVGWVLLPQDGLTPQSALQNAHVAVVQARRSRATTQVTRFRQSQFDNSRQQLALAGDLPYAIDNGHISAVFQPKIAAVGGQVVGFEALARWNHPQRGLIMPDDFIAVADNTGQLGALTMRILDIALSTASQWLITHPTAGVSVNLSARQLLDPDLPDLIEGMLRKHQVPPDLLTCEITESRLMSEQEAAVTAMRRLRALRVRISVDDFGTGYSSLSYLQSLPLDEVKIDKSFILPLARDTQNHRLVQAIIDLVHVLRLRVVAEGVETEDVRDTLAGGGCDVLQGFLIARGLPAEQLPQWLKMWTERVDNRVVRVD